VGERLIVCLFAYLFVCRYDNYDIFGCFCFFHFFIFSPPIIWCGTVLVQ